jgi:hypothetical protein
MVELVPSANAPALTGVAAMRARTEGTGLLCCRTNIYVVKIKGGWNTEAKQREAFPERAFENLKWKHHFAKIQVIRIHYSNDMNSGHLIVVESVDWLQPEKDIQSALGIDAATTLKKYVGDIKNRGLQRPDGTGGIHYAPEGVIPPVQIARVKQFKW